MLVSLPPTPLQSPFQLTIATEIRWSTDRAAVMLGNEESHQSNDCDGRYSTCSHSDSHHRHLEELAWKCFWPVVNKWNVNIELCLLSTILFWLYFRIMSHFFHCFCLFLTCDLVNCVSNWFRTLKTCAICSKVTLCDGRDLNIHELKTVVFFQWAHYISPQLSAYVEPDVIIIVINLA